MGFFCIAYRTWAVQNKCPRICPRKSAWFSDFCVGVATHIPRPTRGEYSSTRYIDFFDEYKSTLYHFSNFSYGTLVHVPFFNNFSRVHWYMYHFLNIFAEYIGTLYHFSNFSYGTLVHVPFLIVLAEYIGTLIHCTIVRTVHWYIVPFLGYIGT